MNSDWRKYNQEFFTGFTQFEIKDSIRKHLLLDTPDYFLKSEHDQLIWMNHEFKDGQNLNENLQVENSPTMSKISHGLSYLFMKKNIKEPAFSYEKMWIKKQQSKNQ